MSYIEERFNKITGENLGGSIYLKQWEIAKEYLPKVLQTISHYFPHYSLHDETHSEAILNNIVRIVGKETIDKMSVVDLWFLLTAAYYHDFGMTVTAEDKNAIIAPGSKFVEYLEWKQKDMSSPMNEFACLFEIKEERIYYKNNQLSSKSIDALRFLIADFFREHHAERSAEKIDNTNSLNLPGHPIPRRIIKLLAKICQAHTQTHEELLSLPQIEASGCGTEDCHPLYIACMLRLGDLLDIDTNRVSEVLLSTLPTIPADSIKYIETNKDITHIHIGKSVIEITATCKDYEVAELVNNWFQMIDNEISFQTKNWYLIVPDSTFGSLPSTGKLAVELEGYDNFNLKDKPQFKIDNSKAIEMLQGAGLYNDPSQCMRELLQNSVDATYLRVFKENPDLSNIEEFRQCCSEKRYQITIDFNKLKVEDGFSYWEFILTDNGLGMSKDDLRFLSCTGSSNQNGEKRKIVESMPAWMRPSGTFGIGFQSVFLITDKVQMKTRHWGREDTLELTMYNPAGKDKGNILLKTSRKEDNPIGTTISFVIKMPTETGWSVNMGERIAISVINNYDFARDESLDIRAAKMMEEIYKFSLYSYQTIQLCFKGEHIQLGHVTENAFDFYDEECGLQVKLGKNDYEKGLFFRNQSVEKFKLNLPLLPFCVNILVGDAKNILTLNRNDIRSEYVKKIQNDIKISTCKYLCQLFPDIPEEVFPDGNTLRQYAAAYIEQHREFIKLHSQIKPIFPEDWKNITIFGKGEKDSYSLYELLEAHHIIMKKRNTLYFFSNDDKDNCYFELDPESHNTSYELFRFLCHIIHTYFCGIQYTANGVLISKTQTSQYICDDARKEWLQHYLNNVLSYARGTMPCDIKYKALEIQNGWRDSTFSPILFEYPVMVCPYIRKSKSNDRFWGEHDLEFLVDEKTIEYVYEHRKNLDISKEQIKDCYELFHQDCIEAEKSIISTKQQ